MTTTNGVQQRHPREQSEKSASRSELCGITMTPNYGMVAREFVMNF
ncbi:hypothetical protein MHH52_14780 [Paenibacillus sp. FSL K6-0276]